MPLVLGVDLGTTNCAAAVLQDGAPLVVPFHQGKLTLPSVVAFVDGQALVGEPARRQAANNVPNTIFAAKRLIGRSYADPQTRKAIGAMGYTCVEGPNGDVRIVIGERRYAIPEISALVLAEIKHAARQHFAQEITHAVITVPAYFNDRQRQATKQAAMIAGLEVLRVVNEPTAAALAYGMHQGGERRVAVYDLGGGTFDVSVLKVGGGAVEVLASDGDAFLGGHDFDNRLLRWLVDQCNRQHQLDVTGDEKAMQRLREAAETAKIRLSDEASAKIALPFLTRNRGGESVHFECEVSREKLESLTADLVEATMITFRRAVSAAGLTPEKIDEVLLVGGMTCMPAIRSQVRATTHCDPASGVHPDLVVAVGAAVQASLLDAASDAAVLLDVTPHNLGILTVANLAETIVPRNTKVPVAQTRKFVTVRDNQEQVKIVVFQGDERQIDKNEILGEFLLEGIRHAPAGEVQIDVCFEITNEGMVKVSATETESGRVEALRISNALAISEPDLKAMIAERQRVLPDDLPAGVSPSDGPF